MSDDDLSLQVIYKSKRNAKGTGSMLKNMNSYIIAHFDNHISIAALIAILKAPTISTEYLETSYCQSLSLYIC